MSIKFREALIQAVQAVVKGLLQPSPEVVAQVASDIVSGADQAAFMCMLMDALRQLHKGNIARYRLRRSDYAAWQALSLQHGPAHGVFPQGHLLGSVFG